MKVETSTQENPAKPLMNAGKGTIHVLYIRDDGSYDSPNEPQPGFLRGISFWEEEQQVHDALNQLLHEELTEPHCPVIDPAMENEETDPNTVLEQAKEWLPELEDWLLLHPFTAQLMLELSPGVERYVEAWDLSIGYADAVVRSDT